MGPAGSFPLLCDVEYGMVVILEIVAIRLANIQLRVVILLGSTHRL